MKRVNLTSQPGAWVDLRDPADTPERLRRPVRRLQQLLASNQAFSGVVKQAAKAGAAAVEDFTDDQAAEMVTGMGADAYDLLDQLNDNLVVQKVAGWSFPGPVALDALLDLPGPVYDELRALVSDRAAAAAPDFSPTPDETSPTEPSSA
ncbi:hypothetical protein [Kitasatospora sp. NBC_01266]|uniref:hypothetical protein n=1 Tax=Kitasatospora sp. NBC_01266 TaxID=2903572 RepID=UPI002E35DE4F|nr:hypothetical protein [Kitasatospora sp. NBC_01266]